MSRWNYSSIAGTKLFLSTVIHNYLNSPRNKVLSMRRLTTICFY